MGVAETETPLERTVREEQEDYEAGEQTAEQPSDAPPVPGDGEPITEPVGGEPTPEEPVIDADPMTPPAQTGEAEAVEEPKPTPPMQIALPGTEHLISDVAGGSQPTSTEARLLGGSLPVEGQFAGEEVVKLIVEAKVGAVEIVYTTDDWGNVKAVKRRHKMRMLSVKRYE